MKRKGLSIILAFVLLLLAACSNVEDKKDQTTESGAESSQATKENGEVDYAFGKYTEPVTIHTVRETNTAIQFPKGEDITNNIWTRAYKERFNINVVTDWVSNDYETKMNLAISSGELPDIYRVNASQLQKLMEADMVMDLTDVFDKYASDRVKGYMETDRSSYESGMKDGKLYGIPQLHYGIIDQPDFVWIRNDWKEELGLQDPQTIDDIKNIALKFMEKHGGYGIAVDQTLDTLNTLAVAWGVHPDIWVPDEDGKIIYGSTQPGMKKALTTFAEWYKLGIIDPEFSVKKIEAMNANVIAGKVGIQPHYQWWGYNPGMDVVTNLGKNAIFYPYNIPSANGEQVIHSVSFLNGNYIVVNKKAENPGAVIKLINFYAYMMDEGFSKESPETMAAFVKDSLEHAPQPFKVTNTNTDYEQFTKVSEAMKTKDTSHFTATGQWQKYNNSVEFEAKGTPAVVGDYLQQGAPRSAYGLAKPFIDNNQYIKTSLWGAQPKELAKYGSTLDDVLTEGFTKIIMGEEDIDYFDKLIQDWREAGGDEVTEAVNKMYGNK
ncbi:extracellular solute-binding protein [Paenibacillus sp. FSL H8-0259]|uniref:extracellular solute-binding protein n=1 Tax=Paenibacillus sp. FSL H8-0259 TaxID=1920423 RepID=UPI0015C2F1CA|nr:extracellular solute-binding protein [Paenibacillus sp. FSL H8-0259]